MVLSQFEIENLQLLENSEVIEYMARKAFGKIHQPPTMEIEDLVQEGQIACIKAVQSWDESKGMKLHSWIQFILQNYFYDIVWYSYRKVETTVIEDFDLDQFSGSRNVEQNEFIFLDFLKSRLSFLERNYIKLCRLEKEMNVKDFRIRVRKKLKLNEEVEEVLRNSIRRIIAESKIQK